MKKIVLHSILLWFISLSSYSQRYYDVVKLPLNTRQNNEMTPAFFEGGIVFSSNRRQDLLVVTTDQDQHYLYNLYYVEKKEKGWSKAQLFSKDLTSRYNESSITFSADYQTAFLTRTQASDSKNYGNLNNTDTTNGIFMSTGKYFNWGSSRAFRFNNENYHTSFPSLNKTGDKLYFAAQIPDGYGGYDIYVSEHRNGVWQEPVNLGPNINTAENEVTPYIHTSGRLYFASRGHSGNGGLDIFYSEFINGQWTSPANLPTPFNSRYDDFAYIVNSEMDTGYFTSNRDGSDDIFMFSSQIPTFPDCQLQIEEELCYEFSESGSIDLDTTTLEYEWDLGDGTKIRGLSAEHCFDGPGEYSVSLNVIDTLTNEIYFSEATYSLLIQEVEQPYITSLDTAMVNEDINFDASKSNIKDFSIENYYWDFGDGQFATGQTVTHSFRKTGSYIIRLGLTGAMTSNPEQQGKACVIKEIIILRNK